MKIDCISVSRSQIFNECELKYKYRYHLQIESPVPEPEYFDYGVIIHKIVEVYVSNRGKTPISEIMNDVLEGKISCNDRGSKQQKLSLSLPYRKRLNEEVVQFLNLTNKIGFDGILEKDFKIDLDPPNQKYVRGFIDRIIIKDDECFILDYKTTKKNSFRKNIKTITKDFQLQVYAWVVMQEYKIPADKIKLALFYFLGGDIVAVQFSKQTLDNVPKILLKMFNEIEEKDENHARANVGRHCGLCAYNSICPYYKLSNKQFNFKDLK